MEINRRDISTSLSHQQIADLFHEVWSNMLIELAVNDDVPVPYDPLVNLPDNDLFLYRDYKTYEQSNNDHYEDMVLLIDQTIIIDVTPTPEIISTIDKIKLFPKTILH